MHKYDTLYGKPFEGEPLKFDFHAIKGKSVKQFTIFKKGLDGSTKPINIKGTLQPFTVTGPKELISIGLECGFGQNNSMGCGYVETFNRDGQDRQDLRSAANEHEWTRIGKCGEGCTAVYRRSQRTQGPVPLRS